MKYSSLKHLNLRAWLFMALCCDLGLFSKKLISPAAHLITGFLHISGGVSTSFSLMFLVIAAALMPTFGCAALMGAVQSMLALFLGMTGRMGLLAPIGYILPGLAIDLILFAFRKITNHTSAGIILASIAASVTACLTTNMLVYRLWGIVLLLYVFVSAVSGALCGVLAVSLVNRLRPVIWAKEGM